MGEMGVWVEKSNTWIRIARVRQVVPALRCTVGPVRFPGVAKASAARGESTHVGTLLMIRGSTESARRESARRGKRAN